MTRDRATHRRSMRHAVELLTGQQPPEANPSRSPRPGSDQDLSNTGYVVTTDDESQPQVEPGQLKP